MAKRDWSWWYRSAPARLMSVSQAGLFSGCNRRWGFKHLDKLPEPMGAAASEGDANHEQLERWCRFKDMPTLGPALGALRYAPAPGVAEVEVPVRVDCDGVSWIGFLDLFYGWDGLRPREARPGEPCAVHDWKFTASMSNALSPDELRTDRAACLYALGGYEAGASAITARWVYTLRGNKPTPPKLVEAEISYEQALSVVQGMSAEVQPIEDIARMHSKKHLRVLDLDADTGYCFSFRRWCPRKDVECNPELPRIGFGK